MGFKSKSNIHFVMIIQYRLRLVKYPIYRNEILVLDPKCSKYSLELSKLTQIRAPEKQFFSFTRWRQKSVLVFVQLYRQFDYTQKGLLGLVYRWIFLIQKKFFIILLICITYFYMIEVHFLIWLLHTLV